jgi:phytoene dehydrogenase-like protein
VIPEGGSGELPNALMACIEDHGGSVYPGHPVEEVLVEDGRAAGVRSADGTVFEATDAVVSTIHVKHLVEVLPDDAVPADFRRGVENWKAGVTFFAAHFAVEEPPAYETEDGAVESVAMGYAGSVENLVEASRAFHRGELHLEEPFVLALNPTLEDETRRAEGLHSFKIVAELPYDLDGPDEWDEIKGDVTDRLLAKCQTLAPNLEGAVVDVSVHSPVDYERINPHCWHGTCHGGDYTPDQYGENRPVKGYENYRGPVDGLYLTGACTWPGGSVSAAPGRNCATVLLDDLGPGIEAGIRSE